MVKKSSQGFLGLKSLVQAWKSEITRRPSVLWRYVLLASVFWITISLRAYQTFLVHPADWSEYGLRLHALWRWVNGSGGVPFGMVWLAPIFRIFPFGQTLLVIQAVVLATGGIAAYRLAGGVLSSVTPGAAGFRLAIPLLYWLHFPTFWSLSHGFHNETAILPLVLWGLAGLEGRKYWGWFFLAIGLTLSPLGAAVASGVAVVWILEGRTSQAKLVRGILLLGLSPFLLIYRWPESWNWGFYPERVFWLLISLGALGGVPLFSKRHTVGVIPVLAFSLFVSPGSHSNQWPIHWILSFSVFGFWSLPEGLPRFWNRFKRRRKQVVGAWAFALASSMAIWAFWDHGKQSLEERSVWLSQEVFHTLSRQGSWRVPTAYFPALARRVDVTSNLSATATADCVILDAEVEPETRPLRAKLLEEGFHEAWACRDFIVLERGLAGCLSKRPECR